MKEITYTLLCDGPSDQVLIPIISWLLREHLQDYAINPQWADLRKLPRPPRNLEDKIKICLELYESDILFIHRDAERESYEHRLTEIRRAINLVDDKTFRSICVIPIRMQEAWLLFDERAIKCAAGNPNSRQAINLPNLRQIEREPNPKNLLYEKLLTASELRGRRRQRFPVSSRAQRVAEYISDFSPLRLLSAFNVLEKDIQDIIEEKEW